MYCRNLPVGSKLKGTKLILTIYRCWKLERPLKATNEDVSKCTILLLLERSVLVENFTLLVALRYVTLHYITLQWFQPQISHNSILIFFRCLWFHRVCVQSRDQHSRRPPSYEVMNVEFEYSTVLLLNFVVIT